MGTTTMDEVRLESLVSDMILEVANAHEALTTSDLQGMAGATAKKIIALLASGTANTSSAPQTTPAAPDVVEVQYWDSLLYNPGSGQETVQRFLLEITDQRKGNGQLFIDVAAEGGDVDDMLCATVEINRLPKSKTDTQCLHLHFDESNLAASFFKQGGSFIIRPETGVSIRNTVLPNGEHGFILE